MSSIVRGVVSESEREIYCGSAGVQSREDVLVCVIQCMHGLCLKPDFMKYKRRRVFIQKRSFEKSAGCEQLSV